MIKSFRDLLVWQRSIQLEFKQFLGMARASNFEVQTQLEIARALGIGNGLLLDEAEKISFEVGKMISGLMKSLGVSR
jgi:four helix bundle protein